MRDSAIRIASPDNIELDFDTASVLDIPRTALKRNGEVSEYLEGPTMVVPLGQKGHRYLHNGGNARMQINAVLVERVPFPLIAVQLDDYGLVCTCEPADEAAMKLFEAAARRNWLAVCMQTGQHAQVIRVDWTESAKDLLRRMKEHAPLAPAAYLSSLQVAMHAAVELLMKQPAELRPSLIGLRVLASEERMWSVVESALENPGSARLH
jgi:hypothetical protein